jgi:RNA polymerase sigma factor (sigma-70 family)
MTSSDDDDLCTRWAGGDQQAGAAFVKRNYASVDMFFRFKVGEHHGVDLTQATFLAAQEGIKRKRSDSNCRSWLFGIARNKLLKHLRDHGREQRRVDPDVSSIADLDPSPTTRIDAGQRQRLLLAALRQLPIDVQMMLELHYWEGMKVADIAEVVEKPVNTVKIQMSRGRGRLETLMEQLAESPEELETTRSGLDGWANRIRQECEEQVA